MPEAAKHGPLSRLIRPARVLLAATMLSLMALTGAAPSHADDPERVMAVQQALEAMDYDPGPADGVVGGNTERAIRAFQEEFGLPVTGKVDAGLLARLQTEVAGGGASMERRLAREGLLRSYTRSVQEGLLELGFGPGPVDGLVGSLTRRAVRAWQTAAGMDATGEISKSLLVSINRARGL